MYQSYRVTKILLSKLCTVNTAQIQHNQAGVCQMIYISWGFANQQQLRKKVADGQALLQDPGTRPWPSWLAWPGTTRSGSKQSSLYRPLTTFLQDYSVIAAEREIMPRFFLSQA